ncbi:hypothetical protein HII31_12891 [Pseudocercospora fuligena]|uniref:BTB domain-containing protein n=1 Tax=Pseudocercospora fuligena TaxID=685502 RepID=A0A8H6VF13_9PEZI|nr:hypothetical protein HII31_12891 [Pseudocercospora fuligena]
MDLPPEPSKILERMYMEDRYCDLNIETPQGFLSAHKSVCYGMSDWDEHEHELHSERDKDCGFLWMEIALAADKYQLPHLKAKCIEYLLQPFPGAYDDWPHILIKNAIWLYEGDRREVLGAVVMEHHVVEIARKLEYIQAEEGEWQLLLACPELLGDVVQRVASTSQAVQRLENPEAIRQPAYLRPQGGGEEHQQSEPGPQGAPREKVILKLRKPSSQA